MKQKFLNFAVLAALSGFALAASVPNTFTAGTPAVASQVNANFAALVDAVTSLESRVNKLEGQGLTAADLAGTYSVAVLSTSTTAPQANNGRMEHVASSGTLTLNANGTFSLSGSVTGFALVWNFSGSNPVATAAVTANSFTNSPPNSGTWGFSGNTLLLTFSAGETASLTGTVGGRLFIYSGLDTNVDTDGGLNLILVARTS